MLLHAKRSKEQIAHKMQVISLMLSWDVGLQASDCLTRFEHVASVHLLEQ
jgi:hypothetical protein